MMRSPARMSSHASVKRCRFDPADAWICIASGPAGKAGLLAGPKDAGHPLHLVHGNAAARMLWIERPELEFRTALPLQDFRHDLAAGGLHHDAVAAPDARCRRDDDDVAV